MRILIDILHPAHVHFFRNFYEVMTDRGHELCIKARDKEPVGEFPALVRDAVRADLGPEERGSAWSSR